MCEKKSISNFIEETFSTISSKWQFQLSRDILAVDNKKSSEGMLDSGSHQLAQIEAIEQAIAYFLDEFLTLILYGVNSNKIEPFQVSDLEKSLRDQVNAIITASTPKRKISVPDQKQIDILLLLKISKFESDYYDKKRLKEAENRTQRAEWIAIAAVIISALVGVIGYFL